MKKKIEALIKSYEQIVALNEIMEKGITIPEEVKERGKLIKELLSYIVIRDLKKILNAGSYA